MTADEKPKRRASTGQPRAAGANRRQLLKGGVLGAAAASMASCRRSGGGGPGVVTGSRVNWRLASSFPGSLDTIFGASDVLAARVAAMTDGRFRIRVYEAGELVPALQVLDAVQKGSAEVGQTCSYYYIGKNPALAFDTCVPFGFIPRQQNAWLTEGGGLARMRELYADFGIICFPSGNTGVQMGGWFRNEIETLNDMKGMKMRIPGLGGKVMDAVGVSVTNISGGEIYAALERGAIDATEWVGPYDDEKLGFYKIAKNYYYPGWWEPGPSMSFLVNREKFDALPKVYQEVFAAASQEAGAVMQARYDAKNPPALGRLLKTDIKIRPFTEEIMKGCEEAAEQLLSDQAAQDGMYRKILDEWRAFRKASHRWFGTAELAYAQFAFAGRS